jgi:hypothetical protein
MKWVVDPRPQVRAELDAARARFQPLLDDLDQQLVAASNRNERKGIRQRRRDVKRRYKAARQQAAWPLRAPVAWWSGAGVRRGRP